jgi:hypothetical protein
MAPRTDAPYQAITPSSYPGYSFHAVLHTSKRDRFGHLPETATGTYKISKLKGSASKSSLALHCLRDRNRKLREKKNSPPLAVLPSSASNPRARRAGGGAARWRSPWRRSRDPASRSKWRPLTRYPSLALPICRVMVPVAGWIGAAALRDLAYC